MIFYFSLKFTLIIYDKNIDHAYSYSNSPSSSAVAS